MTEAKKFNDEMAQLYKKTLNIGDVFDGLISFLLLKDRTSFAYDEKRWVATFYRLVADVRRIFGSKVEDNNFRIRPHPVHGTSGAFKDGFNKSLQIRLFSIDFPGGDIIRFDGEAELIDRRLDRLPGDRADWEEVGRLFLTYWSDPATLTYVDPDAESEV